MQDNISLIGKIVASRFQYYDTRTRRMSYKSRPVLILKCERNTGASDLTVLPLSTITNQTNIDPVYDVQVTVSEYPLLGLTRDSYIRSGKISTVHTTNIARGSICDLKQIYPDLWTMIITNTKEYIETIE
ncbi:type II toxin-antitoxin system PemK/MazF family toxin [Streptococcus danieliae]|nr:type II toxin-antitoxin system PemK/MazF family toxin [Streptococcus danieliae]